jgi:mono/diheme cytochrome c family protein
MVRSLFHPKSLAVVVVLTLALVSSVFAGSPAAKKETSVAPVVQSNDADTMRIQGEQRFRANCGRCHAAPQKFPPRMMATVLRHMRVRATITAEDRRLILFYMSQ